MMKPTCIYLASALLCALPVHARVVSFEVEKQSPYGRYNGVDFNRIEAKVRGEIAPADGPRVRAGHNRGRVISHALYDGAREPATGVGSTEPGTGFRQRRGFALASVTWEYGEGIVVPKFRDASGEERNVEAAAFAAI